MATRQRRRHPAMNDQERAVRTFLTSKGYDPDVTSVAYNLYRASQKSIASAEAEVLRPRGLTWLSYTTLMTLWMLGGCEVRTLARGQAVSKPAVVKSLDMLERAGFVRRVRSTTDRRLVTVELRPAGRAMITRIRPEIHRHEHLLMGQLRADEKRTLASLLRKLGADSPPPPRDR